MLAKEREPDSDDVTALRQSNIYIQIPKQKTQSRPHLFNKLILQKSALSSRSSSFINCKNSGRGLILDDLLIPTTKFTWQQVKKESTGTYFFPLKALSITLAASSISANVTAKYIR